MWSGSIEFCIKICWAAHLDGILRHCSCIVKAKGFSECLKAGRFFYQSLHHMSFEEKPIPEYTAKIPSNMVDE